MDTMNPRRVCLTVSHHLPAEFLADRCREHPRLLYPVHWGNTEIDSRISVTPTIRIGRAYIDQTVDVVVQGPGTAQVSRVHCLLTIDKDGQFWVQNLSTTNQTLKNGTPVSGSHLTPFDPFDDDISLGALGLSFHRLAPLTSLDFSGAMVVVPLEVFRQRRQSRGNDHVARQEQALARVRRELAQGNGQDAQLQGRSGLGRTFDENQKPEPEDNRPLVKIVVTLASDGRPKAASLAPPDGSQNPVEGGGTIGLADADALAALPQEVVQPMKGLPGLGRTDEADSQGGQEGVKPEVVQREVPTLPPSPEAEES